MKLLPQTGDTQVIFLEKPSNGFIDWCIGVAASAINRHPKSDDGAPIELPVRPSRFVA